MGRVIRHKQDYGAMFLCDKRFRKSANKKLISPWILARLGRNKDNQKSYKFDEIIQELSMFYDNAEQTVLWIVAIVTSNPLHIIF